MKKVAPLFGIGRSTNPEEWRDPGIRGLMDTGIGGLVDPGIGRSTVWFCQIEGIPLTLDSLFDCAMIKCYFVTANSTYTRVEIPLKNRSRYERFERFYSKIWAVWAVWAVFFGKTAQTAQILIKKPLKNRSFLAVIFERFFNQDLIGFRAVFERSYKENQLEPTKRPGKVMWPRVDIPKPKMLILNFPTPKKLIIQLPASNVWKNANHTIFIQFQKTIEKRFNLVSPAIWTKYNSLVMKNNYV